MEKHSFETHVDEDAMYVEPQEISPAVAGGHTEDGIIGMDAKIEIDEEVVFIYVFYSKFDHIFSTSRWQFNPEETKGGYPSVVKKSTSQAALSVPVGGDAVVASKKVKQNFKSKSLLKKCKLSF